METFLYQCWISRVYNEMHISRDFGECWDEWVDLIRILMRLELDFFFFFLIWGDCELLLLLTDRDLEARFDFFGFSYSTSDSSVSYGEHTLFLLI